jgi:Domain of unknown function (DUF5615)
MKPRFLLDENLTKQIMFGLRRKIPNVEIERIGDAGMPPRGTLDPDILLWIEQSGYILVTNNRSSMPDHIANHLTAGHHFPGILQITRDLTIGEIIYELQLAWEASEAEEYYDRTVYIP